MSQGLRLLRWLLLLWLLLWLLHLRLGGRGCRQLLQQASQAAAAWARGRRRRHEPGRARHCRLLLMLLLGVLRCVQGCRQSGQAARVLHQKLFCCRAAPRHHSSHLPPGLRQGSSCRAACGHPCHCGGAAAVAVAVLVRVAAGVVLVVMMLVLSVMRVVMGMLVMAMLLLLSLLGQLHLRILVLLAMAGAGSGACRLLAVRRARGQQRRPRRLPGGAHALPCPRLLLLLLSLALQLLQLLSNVGG